MQRYFLFFLLLVRHTSLFSESLPEVVAGAATFQETSQGMIIETTTSRAILHWEDFSIAKGETKNFIQPSSDSAVLNKVTGSLSSEIAGKLVSNGNVFLLNPHGILITKDAVIDTHSFIGSTLDTSNASFIENKELLFTGDKGEILNQGTIKTREGTFFMSPSIDQQGFIEGSFFCAAGTEVLFQPEESPYLLVQYQVEEKTSVDRNHLYTLGIQNSGKVDATSVVEKEGRVFLTSDRAPITITKAAELQAKNLQIHAEKSNLQVGGNLQAKEIQLTAEDITVSGARIDASSSADGGTIYIGGGFQGKDPNIAHAKITRIDADTSLKADSQKLGNGGTIIIWSDEGTLFLGEATAKAVKGDGGLIEVSSHGALDFRPEKVSTLAEEGKAGKLLLDPPQVTISTGGNTPAGVLAGCIFTPGSTNDVVVNTTTLATCLDAGSVEIATSVGSGTGTTNPGRITVADAITWNTGATTLTLTAQESIVIENAISSTNGSLVLASLGTQPGSYNGVVITDASASITMTNGSVTIEGVGQGSGGFSTNGISIDKSITAGNTISLDGTAASGQVTNRGVYLNTGASLLAPTINITGLAQGASSGRGIDILSATIGNSSTNSITLDGTGSPSGTGGSCTGSLIASSTFETGSTGSISITGEGGTSSTGSNCSGIQLQSNATFNTNSLTFTGTGGESLTGSNRGVLNSGAIFNFIGDSSILRFINCVGGTNGTNNVGVYFLGTNSFTGPETILVTGAQGGNGTTGNHGFYYATSNNPLGSNTTSTINITATGGTGSNTTSNNYGIQFQTRAFRTSTSGSVVLNGTGGGNASNAGSDNYGIYLLSGTATLNSLTLTGTGGSGTGGEHHGVVLPSTASYSFAGAENPSVTFTNCTGGSGGNTNYGVFINGATLAPGTITGTDITSGTGSTDCIGFYQSGGTLGNTAIDTTIDITATSQGTGSGGYGILLDNSADMATQGGTISLTGTAGANTAYGIYLTGDSTVQGTAEGGDITLTSVDSILVEQATLQTDEGDLLVLAGEDLDCTTSGSFTSGSGSLILVVDNDNPSSPNTGEGNFSIEDASITSTSGIVQLYSVDPDNDTLSTNINGSPSSSGTKVYSTYYPNGSGGTPFTLFYKIPDPLSPSSSSSSTTSGGITNTFYQSYLASSLEAFYEWEPSNLNAFLGWSVYPPLFTYKGLIMVYPKLVEIEETPEIE